MRSCQGGNHNTILRRQTYLDKICNSCTTNMYDACIIYPGSYTEAGCNQKMTSLQGNKERFPFSYIEKILSEGKIKGG